MTLLHVDKSYGYVIICVPNYMYSDDALFWSI